MSRIVFLGTCGDVQVLAKQLRSSGGFVLQTSRATLLIDPGPGALAGLALAGISVRDLTGIIVSQAHILHSHDTAAVIHAMTLAGQDKHGVLACSSQTLQSVSEFHRSCVERVVQLESGKKFAFEDCDISCLPVIHEGGIGLLIQTSDVVIGFTGDTLYSKELLKQHAGVDVLIVNTTFLEKPIGQHLCLADAELLVEKIKPSLAILTHFGKNMLDHNPLYAARDLQNKLGFRVISAEDGLVIDPASYSATSSQRTLSQFTLKKSESYGL
ncbi:MAG: MBL fold metallo-hydrolase [Candidatus Woesearchaeota archaeon]|nr:MBL fold metallo-hydrolase [Candidatus Woesearchaeota archaeon]